MPVCDRSFPANFSSYIKLFENRNQNQEAFFGSFNSPISAISMVIIQKILEHFDDKDNKIPDFFFFLPLSIVLQIMSGLINN